MGEVQGSSGKQEGGKKGEGAESSLAMYANQQDPKAQMSHDQDLGGSG